MHRFPALILLMAVGGCQADPAAFLLGPAAPVTQACVPKCPDDRTPCDPIAYKTADQRCVRDWDE